MPCELKERGYATGISRFPQPDISRTCQNRCEWPNSDIRCFGGSAKAPRLASRTPGAKSANEAARVHYAGRRGGYLAARGLLRSRPNGYAGSAC
jgi:hypothetical protein